ATRDQSTIPRPCTTLAFAVQPSIVAGFADQRAFRGQGFLARFLYAMPKSKVGRRLQNPAPVPEHVRDTYHRRIVELLEGIQPTHDPLLGEDRPRVLTLTVLALERFSEWRGWLEPQLGEQGRLGAITDWANKLPGAVLRIAGLLHFAEHGSHAALS